MIGRRVGSPVEFHNGRELVRVEYFLIEARAESNQTDSREKRWFPIEEALAALSFETARALLRGAMRRLRSRTRHPSPT